MVNSETCFLVSFLFNNGVGVGKIGVVTFSET